MLFIIEKNQVDFLKENFLTNEIKDIQKVIECISLAWMKKKLLLHMLIQIFYMLREKKKIIGLM